MSTAKLTLRPPPNVEFVQGYPGIPPGPDRPQAAVKGSIELRAGHMGIKAKWVRIELRKVETLPGGGQANTFYDFVGQSPVNVWQTSEEYGMLQTQDFPFYIRIPESIPPTLALDKGAGIKYELVAQVCIKAKKGFLRRDKSTILSTSAPIVIDKHELHTTWPLYQQPEARQMSQEGVLLIVERTNTCFGPGDRVNVSATLRSDSLQTVILRGFEFSLRETTMFRAGPQATKAVRAAPAKAVTIGEQKVPVNATLYGGTQHRAELTCMIPQTHTTATLSSARHIDITYVLSIKALMGTGKPLTLELPVVVSNWPRTVSMEAVRRIGPTPNLSMIPVGAMQAQHSPTASQQPQAPYAATMDDRVSPIGSPIDPARQFNTMPAPHNGNAGGMPEPLLGADEFGRPNTANGGASTVGYGVGLKEKASMPSVAGAPRVASPASRPGSRPGTAGDGATPSVGTRNPRGAANPNRFTITNYHETDDLPSDSAVLPRRPSAQAARAAGPTPGGRWETAEEEKRRLYDSAKANVDRVQGAVARGEDPDLEPETAKPPVPQAIPQAIPQAAPQAVPQTVPTPGPNTPWLTAEEEKTRLYQQAQALAQKTQALAATGHERSGSIGSMHSNKGAGASSSTGMTGAALYQQAMASVNRNAGLPQPGGSGSVSRAGGSSSMPPVQQPLTGQPSYMSAEQEKAMLRRYQDAKAAVDRSQTDPYDQGAPSGNAGYSNYPATPAAQRSPNQPLSAYEEKERLRQHFDGIASPAPRQPPQFNPPSRTASHSSSSQPLNAYEEKERLRRQYEAQDSGANMSMPAPMPYTNGAHAYPSPAPTIQNGGWPSPQAPSAYPPPSAGPSGAGQQILSEKEMLRRKYEAEEAAARGQINSAAPAPPPPRTPGPRTPSMRSPPPVPGGASGFQPLSAVEEKERLRAQYAVEDAGGSSAPVPTPYSYAPPPGSYANVPPPPPLAPRPPPDYIHQTRAEDARSHVHGMMDDGDIPDSQSYGPPPPRPPKLPFDQ